MKVNFINFHVQISHSFSLYKLVNNISCPVSFMCVVYLWWILFLYVYLFMVIISFKIYSDFNYLTLLLIIFFVFFKFPILSSFPYFLPSPFLTCCVILLTSFGGNGPHLRWWMFAQPLHQTVSLLRFSGVFLSCKANARRSVQNPQDHHYHPYH